MDSNINLTWCDSMEGNSSTVNLGSLYNRFEIIFTRPEMKIFRDQLPDSPEADLKRLFNSTMVVEDTVPKQTSAQWEDLTQLLDKFQTIFSQNKYDVGCINLEP
ncbi:hypothetical protein TNCV_3240101 [Trichonephila clavipes]|nr:hypothetical protein TNCV_3240101 [Trichonephila clavipes]